ncbi:cysteine hydrolase (plasmid) [Ruegeria conchae]|uniref:cysteine hydrolase family protein n=1 Tax=Ruegeria conchae TaxID=981384 RepID=UPI0021A85546|nr:cysteine hydrolase [Ruegeria conchae]UWR05186.1 cysteine hydrolase [Ruegeria conchae]
MENSALLVLHYQNSVAHPDGVWGRNLYTQISKNNTYSNASAVLAQARSIVMPVIYVNVACRPGAPELPDALFGIVADVKNTEDCLSGSWGARPIDELAPENGDIQIDNFNSDAFQGTALDQILRARNINTVYLIGQVIEHVVGTTMKRAANSGYAAVLLEDCVGGYSDATRDAMLDILSGYGRILTSKQFKDLAHP